MINESKIITPAYGMNFYVITSEAGAANNAGNVTVNIGDIYLNETQDGLICDVCKIKYEVRDDIPIMLIEEAVPLDDPE